VFSDFYWAGGDAITTARTPSKALFGKVERAFSYGSFYAPQVSTKSNSQPLRIVGIFVSQFEEWTMRGIIGLFSILLTANLQAAENFLGPTELASLKPHPTVEGMTRHSQD